MLSIRERLCQPTAARIALTFVVVALLEQGLIGLGLHANSDCSYYHNCHDFIFITQYWVLAKLYKTFEQPINQNDSLSVKITTARTDLIGSHVDTVKRWHQTAVSLEPSKTGAHEDQRMRGGED